MKFNINIIFLYLIIFLSMYLIDGKKVTKCIVRPKLKYVFFIIEYTIIINNMYL